MAVSDWKSFDLKVNDFIAKNLDLKLTDVDTSGNCWDYRTTRFRWMAKEVGRCVDSLISVVSSRIKNLRVAISGSSARDYQFSRMMKESPRL